MRGLMKGALLASVLAAGCDNYTYFTIYPGVDETTPLETREAIAGCVLFILADGKVVDQKDTMVSYDEGQPTEVCQPGNTKSGVWGSLNYSTARQSGSLEFVLNVYANNAKKPFMQATSGPQDVSPGNEVGKKDPIEVLAKSCLPAGCTRPSTCEYSCPIENLGE